jgi:hypothetical protein
VACGVVMWLAEADLQDPFATQSQQNERKLGAAKAHCRSSSKPPCMGIAILGVFAIPCLALSSCENSLTCSRMVRSTEYCNVVRGTHEAISGAKAQVAIGESF